jgi:2-keto-4-pentenoate hydratase/2-oxohepta-3-ene-1,7-dioic acid hydratase in catechol pathway
VATQPGQEARRNLPIALPSKVVCVGLNYRDHATEAGLEVPSTPAVREMAKCSDRAARRDTRSARHPHGLRGRTCRRHRSQGPGRYPRGGAGLRRGVSLRE